MGFGTRTERSRRRADLDRSEPASPPPPSRRMRARGEIPAGGGRGLGVGERRVVAGVMCQRCISTSASSDAGLAGVRLIGAPSHPGEGQRRDEQPVLPSGPGVPDDRMGVGRCWLVLGIVDVVTTVCAVLRSSSSWAMGLSSSARAAMLGCVTTGVATRVARHVGEAVGGRRT